MSNLDSPENGELWRVQMPSGAIRTMTLDELDEEFQSGVITEATPVLPPGAAAWTKLGEAAGLGDVAPGPEVVPSVAPIAVNVAAPPSASLEALSALDDLDLDSPDAYSFKKKGSKKTPVFIGIGIAVLLVGGLGVAATRAVKSGDFDAKSSMGAQGPAKAAAATPPPAAEDPNPSAPGRVLTEEQKAKLAEADRARAAREDQKRKDRPPPPLKRGAQPKSGTPFSNGGSKYDPLNGAL